MSPSVAPTTRVLLRAMAASELKGIVATVLIDLDTEEAWGNSNLLAVYCDN